MIDPWVFHHFVQGTSESLLIEGYCWSFRHCAIVFSVHTATLLFCVISQVVYLHAKISVLFDLKFQPILNISLHTTCFMITTYVLFLFPQLVSSYYWWIIFLGSLFTNCSMTLAFSVFPSLFPWRSMPVMHRLHGNGWLSLLTYTTN